MINCPICNKEMNLLTNSHLKIHDLTLQQFRENYPNFIRISDALKKKVTENKTPALLASIEKHKFNYENRIKKYYLNPKKCQECEISIPYEKKENKFCSHSCSAKFTNKNRIVVYSEKGLKNLRNAGLKNVKFIIEKAHRNKPVYYDLECTICKKVFTVKSNGKNYKTCSEECRRMHQSLYGFRQTKTSCKCGYYKGIYCASSWELAFLVYHLDKGEDIKRCDIVVPYEKNGKKHNYFPDFLMNNVIYEVKGYEAEDVKLKTQATIDLGYSIELIRKKQMHEIIKEVKENYQIKDITSLYDK